MVLATKPTIRDDRNALDPGLLDELLRQVAASSVYHKLRVGSARRARASRRRGTTRVPPRRRRAAPLDVLQIGEQAQPSEHGVGAGGVGAAAARAHAAAPPSAAAHATGWEAAGDDATDDEAKSAVEPFYSALSNVPAFIYDGASDGRYPHHKRLERRQRRRSRTRQCQYIRSAQPFRRGSRGRAIIRIGKNSFERKTRDESAEQILGPAEKVCAAGSRLKTSAALEGARVFKSFELLDAKFRIGVLAAKAILQKGNFPSQLGSCRKLSPI